MDRLAVSFECALTGRASRAREALSSRDVFDDRFWWRGDILQATASNRNSILAVCLEANVNKSHDDGGGILFISIGMKAACVGLIV